MRGDLFEELLSPGGGLQVYQDLCSHDDDPLIGAQLAGYRVVQPLGEGGMSASEVIAMCQGLAHAGIQTFIFSMANVHDLTPIETIGREVIPAVASF